MPTPPSGSPGATRSFREARLSQLRGVRDELQRDRRTIDAAGAGLAEAMAAASLRLAEAARDADFSPPAWPRGIDRTIEVKLSQTREVTLRMARGVAASERPEGN